MKRELQPRQRNAKSLSPTTPILVRCGMNSALRRRLTVT